MLASCTSTESRCEVSDSAVRGTSGATPAPEDPAPSALALTSTAAMATPAMVHAVTVATVAQPRGRAVPDGRTGCVRAVVNVSAAAATKRMTRTAIEADVVWLHAHASSANGPRSANPGYRQSGLSLARRGPTRACPRRRRPWRRETQDPEQYGAGGRIEPGAAWPRWRSDWTTCHVCAVGTPEVVASPTAVQRLVRMTATVPATARIGRGTRHNASRAGTADPTAAEASRGTVARPPRSPWNNRVIAAAAMTDAQSSQASGASRRSVRVTRPPPRSFDRETWEATGQRFAS